jgi:UDP-N-acetylglucosamine 2-epimerase (non-hydrolysing)
MTSETQKPVLVCVVGARPNFMKIAPVMAAIKQQSDRLQPYLVHTGQHYDEAMKDSFFRQLGIPEPDIDLEVGSGSHAVQTAEIMRLFEPVLDDLNPFAVLVVGDVNSTIACGLVAVKKHIPLIHVEAGLRSGDRQMPEEINRVLTDQISDLLFTTEKEAEKNLVAEGIDPRRVIFAGNVMIDTLLNNLKNAMPFSEVLKKYGASQVEQIEEKNYALLTMHRPSNVDDKKVLTRVLETIVEISQKLPVIFPVHPRTEKMIEKFGLIEKLKSGNITCLPPLPYLEILGLMSSAKVVLTDSGGLQEETTALGVPCITLRESTERPITVDEGTNVIVGSDYDKIISSLNDVLETGGKSGQVPEKWDGRAAERIVQKIISHYL